MNIFLTIDVHILTLSTISLQFSHPVFFHIYNNNKILSYKFPGWDRNPLSIVSSQLRINQDVCILHVGYECLCVISPWY